MSHISNTGLVRYRRVMVNLAQVKHVRIVKNNEYSAKYPWKLKLTFVGSDNTDILSWNFATEAEAEAALDEFQRVVDTFIVPEFM